MNLSYQEKLSACSLVATLLVYGNYFLQSIFRWRNGSSNEGEVGRMVGTVVLLVIIEIAYQIVVAVIDNPAPPMDERDRLISARANRNAYGVLATGMGLVLTGILLSEGLSAPSWSPFPLTPILLAQAVLAAMVAAEAVKDATQLFYYRMGV